MGTPQPSPTAPGRPEWCRGYWRGVEDVSGGLGRGSGEGVEAGELLRSDGPEATPALPGAQPGTTPVGTLLRVTRDIPCGTSAPNGGASRLVGGSLPGPILPGALGWGQDPDHTPGLPLSLVPAGLGPDSHTQQSTAAVQEE